MEVLYTIHHNTEHCSVNINNKDYSYHSLKDLLKNYSKDYLKKNKLIKKSYSFEINDFGENFNKSSLSKDEIENYFLKKKESKAKSWLSRMRRLRKNGKLEKHKIDALNKRGMLWNPSEDDWEKNFSLFQKQPLIEILKKMRKKKYWVPIKEVDEVVELEHWLVKQQSLYEKNELNEENLTRLKAINFPFNLPLNNDNYELKLTRLITLILWIENLSEIGAFSVANKYNLKEKVYVGGNVKINEEIIIKTEKVISKERKKKLKEDNEYYISEKKNQITAEQNAIKVLKEKPIDYFIKQIDRISRKYYPTKSDKDIYEIDKKGKRTAWGDANDRLAQLYVDRYSQKYSYLNNFLNDNFNFPRTKINNVVYKEAYVKFPFENKIKKYAANKMIEILDNYLLNTGRFNKRTYKPISFLLSCFQKDKNLNELLKLNDIIINHQVLSLIYSERIKKIISKIS